MGRVENVEDLAFVMSGKVGTLPSSYIGLSLGAPHNLVGVWDTIDERFRKRLVWWKRQ